MRFHDDVRINEHGTMMSSRGASKIAWMCDSVCREQIGHVSNSETEDVGQWADGDMSRVDGRSNR